MQRADRGLPRILPLAELERSIELIAAIKVRTANRKGCHLSTGEAIRLWEAYGLETSTGLVQAPKGVLKPPAVRFQAQHSNDLWQFDMSPSDLKHLKTPPWVEGTQGPPTLMLSSVVDDRSGGAYQEYHCTYGEAVEVALKFLFNAMAPTTDPRLPFCGRPRYLSMDNGPVARSHVFHQVMRYLSVEVRTHLPRGQDGRRTTARAKDKVERPFRTVKEMHETLYHFHEPQSEEEANAWLLNFLVRYNEMPHRSAAHARLDDWLQHLPAEGLRAMCSWERFCTFAREPERRKVGPDARLSIAGVRYV